MAEPTTSSYAVLRQVPTSDEKFPVAFVVVNPLVFARSQEEAIKQVADTTTVATYAAVPARSWAPVTLKPKTVTTFEIAIPTVAAPADPVTP